MNKAQFDELSPEHRAIAEECYRDGYAAAIETVESCVQRIGDGRVDQLFIYSRDAIVDMLKGSLK